MTARTMNGHLRTFWTAFLVAAASLTVASANEPGLYTYEAHYVAEYKSIRVGSSSMSPTYDPVTQNYLFESQTRATGLLRLARRKPIVERIEFELRDHFIKPLEYSLTDGTRNGSDNVHLVFDWDRSVTVNQTSGLHLSLEPEMLVGSAIMLALVHDVSRGRAPTQYVFTNGESRGSYEYSALESPAIEVDNKLVKVIGFEQHSAGSSRRTEFWLAPTLNFLPIRIEQYKDQKSQSSLTLKELPVFSRQSFTLDSDRRERSAVRID